MSDWVKSSQVKPNQLCCKIRFSSQILAKSSQVKYQRVSQIVSQVKSKYLELQVKPTQVAYAISILDPSLA